MRDLEVLTISAYSTWNRCRKEYFWRWIEQLVKKDDHAKPLHFGSIVHSGLHQLRKGQPLDSVLTYIETIAPQHGVEREDLLKARAMLRGYFRTWGPEHQKMVKSEEVFSTPIWSPETGFPSKTFERAGKIDAVVREDDGSLWILESKTASRIDDNYLLRIWMDSQVIWYALAASVAWGMTIRGVIYDVLIKSRLSLKVPETEEEFEIRRAALAAKNKSGVSNAQRGLGETEAEYEARLDEQYASAGMFHRERVFVPTERMELLERETLQVCKEIREAKRTGLFRMNTSACFHYNRQCQFFNLCAANGNQEDLKAAMYEHRIPNQELNDTEESDS